MTLNNFRQALLGSGMTALVLCTGWPAIVAQEASVEGMFALPGATQSVAGEMVVRETGPLSREIKLVYTYLATGEQVAKYDVELTQQLHILATDAGLTTLTHRHVKQADQDGTFSAELDFPQAGLYHIYTDAVPTGLGQQVLRFDVTVGKEAGGDTGQDRPALAPAGIAGSPLTASDGDYTVALDASQLRAGTEGIISLSVQKNGQPAADLAPYLGVAAHAVFVRAQDLTYVHAHATSEDNAEGIGTHQMPAQLSGDHGGHAEMPVAPAGAHDAHGAPNVNATDGGSDESAHGGHTAGHDAMHSDAAAAGSVSPEMSVYVTPPAAGTYALWIEFIGGDEVLTFPFTIEIPDAQS